MSKASRLSFDRDAFRGEPKAFGKVLEAQLAGQLAKLPLERFCAQGGWPLKVSLGRIELVHEDTTRLDALLYVSFTETGAACCSGDVFEHQHFEQLLLRIDKADGSVSFPVAD